MASKERFISIRLYHNPQDVSAYKQKGDILMLLEEKIEEAVEAYTKVIEEGDMRLEAYYARGDAYTLLQAYEKALQDFKVVVSIDPTYQDVQRRKAHVEMFVAQHQSFIAKLFSWLIPSCVQ